MANTPGFTGLNPDQVEQRVLLGQTNEYKPDTSRRISTILRSNILTLFNGVVGLAFLLLLIIGNWQDALFGLAVISNIIIGIVQEYRSKLILDRLTLLGQRPVRVVRSSESVELPREELVLDDILELSAGDQVPVDAQILSSNNLEVDESLLSGEAEPVAKVVGDSLLSGSLITGGSAFAQVTSVGHQTYASKLVAEARSFTRVSSEIRDALDKLIRWISWVLAPLIVLVVFSQLNTTDDVAQALVRAIASVISMVPQGLVLITSIAFAIAATKLASRKVLLQELAAVEGLARVDLICFDKTGTLTTGQLEFHSTVELEPGLSPKYANWQSILGAFAHQSTANATARALREAFPDQDLEVCASEDFSSDKKYSSITVSGITWYLGAPEVLDLASKHLTLAQDLASTGLRVLMLAVKSFDIVPTVLITLREQINPQAGETLAYFREQGVSVKVISGDHPRTVASVARLAGLQFEGDGFDTRELPNDPVELAELIERESVFGRVGPDQKKRMVLALQQSGHVVAMVGDGVNDALAIKQADIGIAMGAGSAATRAVANLTLLDNNFDRLPAVVSEGRRVIANVERLSRLFLTKTVWAMLLAIAFGILLWEFPFLPRQLSAVDGFTIGIPAFLIALLPNQQLYQPGFLKRALAFCLPAGLVTAIGVIGLSVFIRSQGGWSASESQTAISILLSITGLWVLWTLSRPLSGAKLLIFGSMVLIGIGLFLIPVTLEFFGFSYLSESQLLTAFTFGLLTGLFMGLADIVTRRVIGRPADSGAVRRP